MEEQATSASKTERQFMTPAEVGALFGAKGTTVVKWIEAGWLPAVNTSGPEATRRRWRITQAGLEEFQRRRAAQPASKPAATRRTKGQTGKQYV